MRQDYSGCVPLKKKELTRRVHDVCAPFVEKGETLMQAAETLKGPKTSIAALLTPIGFFLLERPRHLALTNRRLLVVIPPARVARGQPQLEAVWDRSDIEVASFEPTRIWTRMVLRTPVGYLGFNFARVWRAEAEFLNRKLPPRRS